MKIKPGQVVKSILGEDFFESLNKTDIYKMGSRTATSSDEIETGLKIVPRAVLSFLISSLSHLENGDNKNLELPFAPECFLQVTKMDKDSFTGHIYSKGKKINEFINRSIPGIGLVLMTTFELYEAEEIKDAKEKESQTFDVQKLQNIIDERLMLHSLISRVVDQKLSQREAIEILVKEKIAQALAANSSNQPTEQEQTDDSHKSEKLKNFLEQKEAKKRQFAFEKREHINCPYCDSSLYSGGDCIELCICYGEDWRSNIKVTKTENSIKMSFPKNIDPENINMLLQTLKQINKE